MNIVLVEDEEMLLASLTYFLKANNFVVHAFNNGEDAIKFIQENYSEINLVITDLNLPFAGGGQILQICKNYSHI